MSLNLKVVRARMGAQFPSHQTQYWPNGEKIIPIEETLGGTEEYVLGVRQEAHERLKGKNPEHRYRPK